MPISAPDLAIVASLSIADYLRNQPIDQIGTMHPLMAKLMAKRKKLNPGVNQKVNIRKGYGSNFSWSKGEATRSFTKRDTVEQATFEWYTGLDGMYLPWDNLFAAGVEVNPDPASKGKLIPTNNEKAIIQNMLAEQMEAFELGFKEKLDIEIHRDGSSGADAIVGLAAAISLTPSAAGTYGGLDQVAKTYWRNYFAGAVATVNLLATMEAMWRACIRNGGAPDFILAGSTAIDAYRSTLTLTQNTDAGKPKTIDGGVGTGGSTGLFYKGVEIIWDPVFSALDTLEVPAAASLWEKRMYFINCNHLQYEDDGMEIYSPASPNNIRATYVSVDVRARLKATRRNAHGLIVVV